MRMLYFLEPNIELGNPLFRMGTVRNHLDNEIGGLLRSDAHDVEVRLVCSESIAEEAARSGYLEGVLIEAIRQEELQEIYPDYLEASWRWYEGDYTDEKADAMAALIRDRLGDFEPDVIVCYESNAPFLTRVYPDALFLNNTLGMFSRAPFPETSVLDPFGVGKDAFLARYRDEILGFSISDDDRAAITDLKRSYREAILAHSPVSREAVRQGYEHVLLLPLQVSRYFMFDANLPSELRFENQLQLVEHVLEQVDDDVGVFVSMHGAEDHLMTPSVLADLKRRHPNFLHSPTLQKVRWVSQHLLPNVDGVITVSSSVGLQAMIWDLPVVVVGRSHIHGISDSADLADASGLARVGRSADRDGALFYLLTRYYPLLDRYHHDPEWFCSFLKRSIEKQRAGEIGFDFFDPIDEPAVVFDALKEELRESLYLHELARFASHLRPEDDIDLVACRADIEGADVVSFDVFDTLITRTLAHHGTVFDMVEREGAAIFEAEGVDSTEMGGYTALRLAAGTAALERARASGREELDYGELFVELGKLTGLSTRALDDLRALELAIEKRVHRARMVGVELLRYARAAGKRVIFVSDMYYPRAFIEGLLADADVGVSDHFYLSADVGVLKKTGKLFEHVLDSEGRDKRIVHFGDNLRSDVQMAKEAGLAAHHLPGITERYVRSPMGRALYGGKKISDTPGRSLLHGVISRRLYDAPQPQDSFVDASPFRLGYEAGGPIFFAFATWLRERSRRDGVERLYFMARDGFVVKEVFDRLVANDRDAPTTRYILASRRAFNVASLTNETALQRSLELRFSEVRLRDILLHRFGVEAEMLKPGSIEEAGFSGADALVDIKRVDQLRAMSRLYSLNADLLLECASVEREALLEYLEKEGMAEPGAKSIVDIGHNGSLQEALGRLLGDRAIGGYYFATFFGAKAVYNLGHPIDSYLLHFEEQVGSLHPYCSNIGLFEFLFLPSRPSFVRMVRSAEGVLEPEYVEGDESKRFAIIDEVHRGVLAFCDDVLQATGGNVEHFEISSGEANVRFLDFCMAPSKRDAQMLEEVTFVDAFGGNAARPLIASSEFEQVDRANFDTFVRSSWWREGARALVNGAARERGEGATLVRPRGGKWGRKLRKLRENPWQFLVDMKIFRRWRPRLVAMSRRWATRPVR